MSEILSIAENETGDLKEFLPLKTYQLLGEPNRFVIVGARGTGKTRLFKTLQKKEGFRQIVGTRKVLFNPKADNTQFIVGYDYTDVQFCFGQPMEKLLRMGQEEGYWKGNLLFLLCNHFKQNSQIQQIAEKHFDNDLFQKFSNIENLKKPSQWIEKLQQADEDMESFLDDVDAYLNDNDQWIFFTYDSLDHICPKYVDWFPYIRALMAFWFNHLHRWKRLKCKIFLRKDLYDSDRLAFPDSSKLRANILQLEWNTISLYRLLIKRLANCGCLEVVEYLQRIPELICSTENNELGYIPTEQEELIERFVNDMLGKYMGKNAKKGQSFSWVPNHLQDNNGALAPRAFLKCFSVAAEKMCAKPEEINKLEDAKILLPQMIQGAVLDVSKDRVIELKEEYRWIEQLQSAFRGATMLMDKSEFIKRINMDLWTEDIREELPAQTPEGIFDMLEKLGIVFIARDGRVNVPEIYLHGFNMKRKGGLRRL